MYLGSLLPLEPGWLPWFGQGCISWVQQELNLVHNHFLEDFRRVCRLMKRWGSPTVFFFFFLVLLLGAFFHWVDHVSWTLDSYIFLFPFEHFPDKFKFFQTIITSIKGHKKSPSIIELPLKRSLDGSMEQSRVSNYPVIFRPNNLSSTACPEYFRWIHEDLRIWKSTGISRAMVERAKDYAHFRLVILKGKIYVEKYKKSFHTRDVFTIWGILQLLRLYPGKVPDLELMFWCEDRPVILKKDYQGTNATSSPSIFQYCGREDALGIVFPDWTFWGW